MKRHVILQLAAALLASRRWRGPAALAAVLRSHQLHGQARHWQFQGSNDGSAWTTLGTQSNQTFAQRYQMKTYTVASPAAYRYYRLNLLSNSGSDASHGFQLAELALLVEKERANARRAQSALSARDISALVNTSHT